LSVGFIKRLARRKLIRGLVIFLIVWAVVCATLGVFLVVTGDKSDAKSSDVIIVLGAGLKRNGDPGDALYRRSVWAARAYLDGLAPAILCTGGISDHQSRSEASACRELIISEGVPSEVIFLEDGSHSTEQNAINAKAIMATNGWEMAIIVTDSFHLLRADWIFTAYGIPHTRHPVPRNWVRWTWYSAGAAREIVAMHWFLVKQALNLPQTDFIF
jgi:uncharacterized SAM-binding protein YcdF (DUF218 family)